MMIDGIVELDDQEFADIAEPADIWSLRMRVIDESPGAVEAMIDMCIAAAELVGEQYENVEQDWDRAFRDLQEHYWAMLNSERIKWDSPAEAKERIKQMFTEQCRSAVARWEQRIADETNTHEE